MRGWTTAATGTPRTAGVHHRCEIGLVRIALDHPRTERVAGHGPYGHRRQRTGRQATASLP